MRLHCGCVAVPVNWFLTLFHHFSLNLRTLYIVWSLVRRRVNRRLTRLQTMCNAIKYRKILWNVALRLQCRCVYFFNLLKTSTVQAVEVSSHVLPYISTESTSISEINGISIAIMVILSTYKHRNIDSDITFVIRYFVVRTVITWIRHVAHVIVSIKYMYILNSSNLHVICRTRNGQNNSRRL